MSDCTRVLVVDDDASLRHATLRPLRQAGYEVVEAATGTEGLRLAGEERPDLILLDVVLPDIDGLEVCRLIKADPELAGSHVVLMSALQAVADGRAEALDAGADGYIARPISSRELVARVEAQLRLQRTEGAFRERTRQLDQRVRELNCLYSISRLGEQPGISLEEILQRSTALIPPAFRQPDAICACILLEDQDFRTDNFQVTDGRLASELNVWGNAVGWVEVYDLRERPDRDQGPVPQEEPGLLLDAIAEQLSKIIEARWTQDASREGVERYRTISELMSDLAYAFRVDPDGRLVREWITHPGGRLTGFSSEELAARGGWTGVIHPQDRAAFQQHVDILLSGQQHVYQLRIVTKEGEVRWLEDHGRPVWDEAHSGVVRIYGAARDITAQKQAEQALRESEKKYRSVVEQSFDGIRLVDAQGTIIEWNDGCERITGWTRDTVLGRPIWEVLFQLLPEERQSPSAYEHLKRGGLEFLSLGQAPWHGPGQLITIQRPDGTRRFIEELLFPVEIDETLVGCGITRDVTEWVQAETALAETTQLLETILDHTHMLVAYLDPQFNFVRVNRAYAEADGREPSFYPGKNHFDLYPHAENEQIFGRVLETGQSYFAVAKPFEYAEHPERGVGYWDWSLVPTRNPDGSVAGLVLTLVDVTQRVKTSQALRDSQEQLALIIDHVPAMIGYVNADLRYVYANSAYADWYGLTKEELIGRHLSDIVDEGAFRRASPYYDAVLQGQVVSFENIAPDRIGEMSVVSVTFVPHFDQQGQVKAFVGMLRETTERKRMEETLRQSEQELRIRNQINSIFLTYPDEEMYVQMLQRILSILSSEYGTFGYFDQDGSFVAPALTRQIYWEKCNVPEKEIIFQKGTFGGIWGRAIQERRTLIANEGPFHMPDGHIPIQNTMVTPIIFREELISAIHLANKPGGYDEQDRVMLEMMAAKIAPVLYARLQRDRREEERRQVVEALRESEEKHRDLVENINDVIYELDADGVLTYISPASESLLGYRAPEMVGQHFLQYIAPEDWLRIQEHFRQLTAGQTLPPNEYRVVTKSGVTRWVRTSSRPKVVDGQPAGVRGVLTDVTEQVEAEQQLRAALAEKETLLKEIHHRVKNNLQLISAMLDLQARATADEHVIQAFEESQHRILSMAGIHEQLYSSKDLSRVDMATYLQDLAADLQRSYGRPTIDIRAEAAPVSLDVDQAIPCGLIVNELVSNALKHAFPRDRQRAGEVQITLYPCPASEGKVQLTVSDNGIGLPADLEPEHSGTLGLTMVGLLARQLRASLELDRTDGTTFRVTFDG